MGLAAEAAGVVVAHLVDDAAVGVGDEDAGLEGEIQGAVDEVFFGSGRAEAASRVAGGGEAAWIVQGRVGGAAHWVLL